MKNLNEQLKTIRKLVSGKRASTAVMVGIVDSPLGILGKHDLCRIVCMLNDTLVKAKIEFDKVKKELDDLKAHQPA